MPSFPLVSTQAEAYKFPALCPSDSSCHESAEICEDNRQTSSLEGREGAAISGINARRDLLTIRFPLEIVSHIFEEYVKLHPRLSGPLFRPLHSHHQGISSHFFSVSPRAPLNLGAVCRLWRSIAWIHPPLWNNLYIDISSSGYEHGPEIVKEWLGRSRALPLDIRVSDGDDRNSRSEGDHAVAIMNIIKQFSSRWRSLDIRIEHSNMMYNLEDSYLPDHPSASSNSLLRHLSLVGGSYVLPFEKLLYPSHWTCLSHLHIRETHVQSLRWMLERISESSAPFTHLSVEQIWGTEEEGTVEPEWILLSQPVIPLLTLFALFLGPPTVETLLLEVFNHLHAPALRSFECDLTGPSCFASFMAFVSRSGCSLQELVLTELDEMPVESILSLLRELPLLVDLTLLTNTRRPAAVSCVSEALSEKNYRATNAPILPKLKRLHIGVFESVVWPPIVGIYIKDPSSIRHPKDQIQMSTIPRPGRDSLQLSVFQQVRHGQSRLVDVNTLAAFAYLWQQHSVRIQVQEGGPMFQEKDILVSSYSYYDDTQSEDDILTSLKQLASLAL